jgi:putative flippase GtrA
VGRSTLRSPLTSTLASRWAAFNTVGAIGVVVQIAVFAYLSRGCHWHYLWATATAVEAAVLHNFAWHQCWTWSDRRTTSPRVAATRFLRFQVLNGSISLAGNLALMRLMTGGLGVDPIPANIIAICVCASLNFAASELIVFRPAPPVLLMVVVASAPAALGAQSRAAQAGWEQHEACVDARYRTATAAATFFMHDREGLAGWRDTVAAGSVALARVDAPLIPDGKLLHWLGAVFVPGTTVDALVTRLEAAAGRESESYSDVVTSKLLARDGDRLRVFMKLRRTSLITVTYNTEHTVEYRRIDASRASARSVATRIAELSEPGTPREHEKAANDDSGFLWRLNAYWRYEAWKGGVLVECESVSLSRPVPLLLRPIAGPIVDRIARESLEGTLRNLRAMVADAKRR